MCATGGRAACDSCFGSGDGEAVGYENVEEPVRLDAGDVRERWWLGGGGYESPFRRGLPNRDSALTLTFRSLRLRLRGWSQGDSRTCMVRVQVEEIVCLGTNEVK